MLTHYLVHTKVDNILVVQTTMMMLCQLKIPALTETPSVLHVEEGPDFSEDTDVFESPELESKSDLDSLRSQLQHYLAALFLKMKTVLLNSTDMATQEIVEHLTLIFTLSQPLLKMTIKNVFKKWRMGSVSISVVFYKIVCLIIIYNIFTQSLVFLPPDVLHDLFEGIVPVELALCLGEMIRCKYFTLEDLNKRIISFPYQHTDKVDRPQPIPKTFASKQTIGGNGHENATLVRLLPLIVGDKIQEGDVAWCALMDLKEVVELMLSTTFTEETI